MTIKWKPSDVDKAYLQAREGSPANRGGMRQGFVDFVRGRRNGGQGNGQGTTLTPRPPQ
ncbi:hypothetical protein LCGC14_1174240 [marine sediment metagenome]|uniref:Uncharacterized protein n=1 Tax=marine sediment metagenome TaxID=412755 RepID=A0A0F9PUH8_9ZZZZ